MEPFFFSFFSSIAAAVSDLVLDFQLLDMSAYFTLMGHWVLLPVKVKLFKKKGKKIFVISFYSRREYRSRGAFSRCDAAPAVFRSLSRPNQQQHSLRFSGYDVTILSIREKLRASLFCKKKIIQVNFNKCADVFTRAQEIHVDVTVHQNVANTSEECCQIYSAPSRGRQSSAIQEEPGLLRTCSGCLPGEVLSAWGGPEEEPYLYWRVSVFQLGTPRKEVLGEGSVGISALPPSPGWSRWGGEASLAKPNQSRRLV